MFDKEHASPTPNIFDLNTRILTITNTTLVVVRVIKETNIIFDALLSCRKGIMIVENIKKKMLIA